MKLVFMHLRSVAVLLAVAVLISLGTIQYADASIFNERASSPTSKTEVDGTIYHNTSRVEVHFNFDGYGGNIPVTSANALSVTGGLIAFPNRVTNGTNSFYHEYSVYPLNTYNIVVTVTYPANSFDINSISNDAVTYTFVADRKNPTFQSDADFSTVELTVGDESPTLPTLQCHDPNILTTSALRSGSVDVNLAGDYPVEYTCRDKAGNSATETKTYRVLAASTVPAVPANISIASDNARDTSLAKIGDIVTITFDTESDSTVKGTIGGGTATFTFNGASSTLARTLNGTESSGVLAFSFVQSNSNGDAATQTAVRGGGIGSSVTADFAAPAAPIFTNSTITVSTTPIILAGTAEADSVITLYKGETLVTTVTATGVNFEFTGVALTEGSNSFTITATDASSNVSVKSDALVITLDTTAPIITVDPLEVTLELNSASPTLLDGVSTDDGSTVTTTGTVVVSTVGDYTIRYDSTDGTNAATTVTRTYHVTDTTAPIITVDPLEVTLELDSASPTLLDGVSTDDGSTVTTTGTVDVSTVDDYTIRYDSTDGTNAATTVTRTYHVTDTTAPIITVDPLEVTLELDSASPTLLDGVSTDDGSTVTTTGTVDVSTVDDYTIRYDSTDGTNAATTVTRTYHVTDTTAPIITVDPLEVTLELDSASPTLLDGVSTDDGSTVTTTGTVVVSTVGDYTIRYDSTDGTNAATTVTRTYHVTDTTDPVFATSTDTTNVTFGDTVPTLSTLCTDANTITVTNDAGSTTFAAEGAKTVLYTCTDAAGNTATQSVSYSVAAADTTDPVYAGPTRISVIHNSHGGTFNAGASGVQCTDDTDGTVNAVTTHARDFTTRTLSSQYDIRFVCTDAADNSVNFTIRYVIIAQPIVSIAIEDVPSSTNDGSIEVSITFGADVTGFETRDIRVTNNAGHVLSGSGSSYTLTITPTQDGTITVTIPRGAAQAGSAINAVASFSFVSDTKAPDAPIFTNSTAPVSTSPITLAGTAEADSVVTLYKDETVVATATATGGTFEFIGVELDEESNSFTVTATDASSNVSAKSGALVITLDTIAPAAPIFTNSTTDVSTTPVTLAGTAEADSTVELFKGETSVATATATTGGNFEFAGVTLDEGSNDFTITATDACIKRICKISCLGDHT